MPALTSVDADCPTPCPLPHSGRGELSLRVAQLQHVIEAALLLLLFLLRRSGARGRGSACSRCSRAGGRRAAAASPSAATGASSISSLISLATAIAWSCSLPRRSSGISTPVGSFRSDMCTMSPRSISPRSTSMYSGRSFGRHEISTSLSSCVMTTPDFLPAGDFSWLRKCSGTRTRIASFSLTRWKSRCSNSCLNGWRCMSRRSTFCTSPPRFRSRIDE